MSSSLKTTIFIPNSAKVPDGPIKFESVGNVDAFIKQLEEKHVETKRQLFNLSLRPTSFDHRGEFKAHVEFLEDQIIHFMTSKKVHRMHFIGSYHFANSEDFEKKQ